MTMDEFGSFYIELNFTNTLEFSTRVGTIVDQKKVLKQAEVVHNIKVAVKQLKLSLWSRPQSY